MIKSIDIKNLRNSEFSQFLSDILDIADQNDPEALKVFDKCTTLRQILILIESLLRVPAGNDITMELEELDRRRDKAFKGIRRIINGYLYSKNEGLKISAALLADHLAIFGANIPRDNYQSETAKLRSIMDDWDLKPNLAAALTDLGLQPWIGELANANGSFNEQYLARAAESGTVSNGSMKTVRLQATEAYYQLRDCLNAYYKIHEGADPFGKTVGAINGLIDNYNILLSHRSENN